MEKKQRDREVALIEEWAKKAVQSGSFGVKIIRKNGFITEIELSNEVPYGHIHEYVTSNPYKER